jgi:ABC-type transporter Mla MlaB component
MDWKPFLEDISDRLRLTPEQRKVFLERLADENFEKSEAKIASQLSIGVAALKKHMSEIYDRAGQEFPSLAKIEGRGKLRELRACLKESCKEVTSNHKLKQEINPQIPPELDRKSSLHPAQKSPLKAGAPFPMWKFPENFVERPDVLNTAKAKLLTVDERTLVVAGMGGLGKTVLAKALVKDLEVQARFADGILWVTLGQSPDLQILLGGWIQHLDKSRETYSATNLELASQYLHNLLAERQMLLVVDDVWNAAHAEWFRVGGEGCRVLVTTRTAFIPRAERYTLKLMTPDESVALIKGELREKWTETMEPSARKFAKLLGYLPLALKLIAVQVVRGRKWEMLKKAFLQEVNRLRSLDYPREKLETLSDDERREYSLRACFDLSLQWLEPELLKRFIWLGVLQEDAIIQQKMVMTLWNVEDWEAEEALLSLYESSLLNAGLETLEGEQTYQMHDLLHLIAQDLIEHPQNGEVTQKPMSKLQNLSGLGLTLAEAHRQFLERYRERASNHRWDGLPNDGYIHRHLTWHLEQANWDDELHALMSMSDNRGRNAWFEACDRLGQPAIFVNDVARGWNIAERGYEGERAGAIVLQCRYALITATLNSLVANLPIGMMAEFVKHGFWTVEQAWAYVEQMQDEKKNAEAIQALAPYLSNSLFHVALEEAREIQDESSRAVALSELAKIDSAYFEEALQAAREIEDESSRARVLIELTKIDSTYFGEALQADREIEDESSRGLVLSELAKIDSVHFNVLLKAAREIKHMDSRASVLITLAKIDLAYFEEALQTVREIKDEFSRAKALGELAKIDSAYFEESLTAARKIKNEYWRALVLSELAKINSAYFEESLTAARKIKNEYWRALVLSELAKINSAYFEEASQTAREIEDEFLRALVLSELAKIDSACFEEALQTARDIKDENWRAFVLSKLAKINSAYFDVLLEAAREVKDDSSWASVLSELAKIDSAYFEEALQAARHIKDEFLRAMALSALTNINSAYFKEALTAARDIKDELRRTSVLSTLAKIDSVYFEEALQAARHIKDEDSRAFVLSELANINSAYFEEALAAAREIKEYNRALVLSALAKIDSAYLDVLLEAATEIKDEYHRASVLSALANIDSLYFEEALTSARDIKSEYHRASVLSALANIDSFYFEEALTAVRDIKSEFLQTLVLSALAKQSPQNFLSNIYEAILAIVHKPSRAQAISGYITRLSPPYSEWQTHLHILAHRKRSDLMEDLVTLHPAILHLGGTAAVRGVVDTMRQVCSQWK